MNRKLVAKRLITLAKALVSEEAVKPNVLNGLRKPQASKYVNNLLYPLTKGIFSDESWQGVNRIWDELRRKELDWGITDNHYEHDEKGRPKGKTWKFEVYFLNDKGKKTVLYGVVTASGAGSVEEPLEKYDIVSYVS